MKSRDKIQAMEEFKIVFWKEPYQAGDTFIRNIESFVTTAIVKKSMDGTTETFHIKLTDIGLNSLYGEFDIVKANGFWQTSDQDPVELNVLKWNIIHMLIGF